MGGGDKAAWYPEKLLFSGGPLTLAPLSSDLGNDGFPRSPNWKGENLSTQMTLNTHFLLSLPFRPRVPKAFDLFFEYNKYDWQQEKRKKRR